MTTAPDELSPRNLAGPQATLLMPLWARAVEADRDAPIVRDPVAKRIVSSLEFDFGAFRDARVDALGYCVRSALIDRFVRDFLSLHPAAAVVEMGVGLDARYERLDNGSVRWFELDLPETIALRREFFDESPRRTILAGSVLETGWLDAVAAAKGARPVMLVGEGLFYFISRRQVAALLARLADALPGARVVFDCQSPLYLRYCNLRHPLRDSRLQFSLRRASEIERWDPRFRVERFVGFGDRPYYDDYLKRFSPATRIARRVLPCLRRFFQIAQVRLA